MIETRYYIKTQNLGEKTKWAIIDEKNNQVSDWFDGFALTHGCFQNPKIKYFVAKIDKAGYAIFEIATGKQISDWFLYIFPYGLLEGKSQYYIAVRKIGEEAIFDIKGKQISDWFNYISPEGLISGESKYYIAQKKGKKAIFNKNSEQISCWFEHIEFDGLIKGESKYYIVKKKRKQAIFDVEGYQISNWFERIEPFGLIKGTLEYYVAGDDKKLAFFDIHGNQISDWFERKFVSKREKFEQYLLKKLSQAKSKKEKPKI